MSSPPQRHLSIRVYLALILALAIALRCSDLSEKPLWYDELQSVTHASLPIGDLLESVRAFDPHPPLYYLQLHCWMLLGNSDTWIQLNSVAWSILALGMVFLLARDLLGKQFALLAALFFAVAPFAILYAREARMYSMLMFLGPCGAHGFRRFLAGGGWRPLLGAALATEAFLWSHGAGLLLLASLFTGLAFAAGARHAFHRRRLLALGSTLAGIGLSYLPWLLNAASISVPHTLKPGFGDILDTLFTLAFGLNSAPQWLQGGVLLGLAAGGVAACWRHSAARGMVLAALGAPVIFCFVISHLYRPIWLPRTLAHTVPFGCIALAFLFSSIWQAKLCKAWARHALAFAAASILFCCTLHQKSTFTYIWHIQDAARFLQASTRAGDRIYVVNQRLFWGMGWYFIGPGVVNPLDARPVLASAAGVRLLSETPPQPLPRDGQNSWLVYRAMDNPARLKLKTSALAQDFGGLKVVRLLP